MLLHEGWQTWRAISLNVRASKRERLLRAVLIWAVHAFHEGSFTLGCVGGSREILTFPNAAA